MKTRSELPPSPNHDPAAEAVCEYLRRNYREYTRTKLPVFRQQVERAVEAIARKGGVTKAELRLQVGGAHVGADGVVVAGYWLVAAVTVVGKKARSPASPPVPPSQPAGGGAAARERSQQPRGGQQRRRRLWIRH